MTTFRPASVPALILLGVILQAGAVKSAPAQFTARHGLFTELLPTYVHDGVVDYKNLTAAFMCAAISFSESGSAYGGILLLPLISFSTLVSTFHVPFTLMRAPVFDRSPGR